MEQVQALMKDSMAKMAAADAAMKARLETEQASMKSPMGLQQAMNNYSQNITGHIPAMAGHMAMMPAAMDMEKKNGMPIENADAVRLISSDRPPSLSSERDVFRARSSRVHPFLIAAARTYFCPAVKGWKASTSGTAAPGSYTGDDYGAGGIQISPAA